MNVNVNEVEWAPNGHANKPTVEPTVVIIIPYRDRAAQLDFFRRHMKYVLEDYPEMPPILVVHQADDRPFNRGAMKNIGAIYAKQKWPNSYNSMTLVFHDVDSMPLTKGLIQYETTPGTVKHFFGFKHTLGGIVSICGADFDKCGGFPNLWAWGFEDNQFQARCLKKGIQIDRSVFYPIYDRNIIHLQDGLHRTVNRREFEVSLSESLADSAKHISNLQYKPAILQNDGLLSIEQVNVSAFTSKFEPPSSETFINYDLRNGAQVFKPLKPVKKRGAPLIFL